MPHEITLTDKSLHDAPPVAAQKFGDHAPRMVVWMRRIGWVEGHRVALLESWMDASLFGEILHEDFSPAASLSKRLRSMTDTRLHDSGGVLSVTTVDEDMAMGLDLSLGASAVQIWRCTEDVRDRVVDVSRVVYDPSVFSFVVK